MFIQSFTKAIIIALKIVRKAVSVNRDITGISVKKVIAFVPMNAETSLPDCPQILPIKPSLNSYVQRTKSINVALIVAKTVTISAKI